MVGLDPTIHADSEWTLGSSPRVTAA